MFGTPRMLLWMTLAAALIVGGILVLATGEWWTLLIPVALHAVGSALVVTGVFKVLDERDKPDPVTQARLDDEGERPAATS
jgi:membrane protein implicated in regulation of membrane protease activity